MPEANNTPKQVPDFENFGELSTKEWLFDNFEFAYEWFSEYGHTVLKEAGMEIVQNLLTANSSDRRARGQVILERAIQAQVAWIEMFQDWAKAGKFAQLKKLTDAVRDDELSNDEHAEACKELLDAHVDLVIKTEEDIFKRKEALAKIHEHLKEKAFISWVFENSKLVDNRPTAKDPEWAVKALSKVQEDKGDSVPPNTLSAVASNLDYWSKLFFGEAKKTPKVGARKGGRSAEKRAADRAFTLANKGPGKSGSKAKR